MVMVGLESPLSSFKVVVLPMDSLEEAAKLAWQDGMAKYVVQVRDGSIVKSTRPAHTLSRLEGNATEMVIAEFDRTGLELQDRHGTDMSDAALRAEFYDRHIHLQRREPLQDHALFYIGHLTDSAPRHTQAERAAIITVAALHFKKRLEGGQLEQNALNGVPLCGETLQWLFHTTQELGLEVDRARKYLPSNNIVVMRKSRLYKVAVHEQDHHASLARLFADIIASSEPSAATSTPAVSVLTSKRRDECAALRSQLKHITDEILRTPGGFEGAARRRPTLPYCRSYVHSRGSCPPPWYTPSPPKPPAI